MDPSTLDLTLFLAATFLGSVVAGLAGFAFGLVAAAAWLHVLTPVQTASLIVAFGLIVQGVAVWKLRKALQWGRLWPFLIGAAIGVPAGVMILAWADPGAMRLAIGAFLILYSTYALLRPAMGPIKGGGAAADAGVGVINGILGGATGLAGIIVTIWCGLRGWPKVPAGQRRRLCHERRVARRARRNRSRHDLAVRAGIAGSAGGNLARVEALRPAR
jgi:uncharacterized membrane protein YfcA